MSEMGRIPTKLWLDGQLRYLSNTGISYYILHTGDHHSGMVCIKLRFFDEITLYLQEWSLDQVMGWRVLLPKGVRGKTVEEGWADAYIDRAVARDPDLWVVEIETREDVFPLEGLILNDAA